MKHVFICYGECVDHIIPEFASEDFKKEGTDFPDWAEESDDNDSDGLDKHNVEANGSYKIEVELPKGTMLCRYGADTGSNTTPIGTEYELIGLPWKKETLQYHEYRVIANGVRVKLSVTKGRVAPAFDSPGGAIQFIHHQSIAEEMATGKLEEVDEWLKKKKKYVRSL